ncbi:MAG TPA: diaminopimelate epimerase [Micromonosporaceae bacterium]
MAFAKGHGTGNDFVIIPDPGGTLDLPGSTVAALCDRRRGLGGDGLLRVVRTEAEPEVADHAGQAGWFMDYRNADGSLAEMCGNGVRVYARYLVESGLAPGPEVAIWTRAGLVHARIDGEVIAVDMPVPGFGGAATARLSGVDYPGTVVTCGNPNLVCQVADPDTMKLAAALELDRRIFPAGANVEFVAPVDHLHVRMRVVERGVGETLSCGSGACAVAALVWRDSGLAEATVTVDVPGGRLAVTLGSDRCVLAGPAVIVGTGEARLPTGVQPDDSSGG